MKKKPIVPSWERISLHKLYLRDDIRNSSYRKAIRKLVTPQSVVIDVGCGTGILGFFAAQRGCKKLYSIEMSNFIHHAKDTAERNGFGDRIEFVQNDFYKVRLKEKADLIIQEQIGDYVWDEEMIEKMNHARKWLLKRGGKILPAKFDLYLVPVHSPATYIDEDFWKARHYGIDFGNLAEVEKAQLASRAPFKVALDNSASFLGPPVLVQSTDLQRDRTRPKSAKANFEILKSGTCTGILGFMDVYFDPEISFSTRPSKALTNWGQFLIPIHDQTPCAKGDRIRFDLSMPTSKPASWAWAAQLVKRSPPGRRSKRPRS